MHSLRVSPSLIGLDWIDLTEEIMDGERHGGITAHQFVLGLSKAKGKAKSVDMVKLISVAEPKELMGGMPPYWGLLSTDFRTGSWGLRDEC